MVSEQQKKILVIEDDEDIRTVVTTRLRRAGYETTIAADGKDGLRHFYGDRPDLVVLDVAMPIMDGWQVLERLREISDVPVLILTAAAQERDKLRGLRSGADDYITKPFSPRELMARVKAVLRRSEESPAKPRLLDVDGYEIDGGKRTVTTPASVVVEPTAKEFDLLWFLAENAGLAMSRSQILEGVWGYEYFGETRTVDVHIRQLRKKIEGIPIETVWGVGYRLGR